MSGLGLPVLVRPYTRSDLNGAARVMYRSARLAYRNINWNADQARVLEAFEERQGSKWSEIHLSVCGSEVNGVMCLEGGHVDQLFVLPEWQGKGIGKKLLSRAAVSYPDGYTLDVFVSNTPALRFYQHLGLRIIDEFDSQLEGEREYRLQWLP